MKLYPDLTQLAVHPLDLVLRGVVVYLWVLVLLRVSGKRQLGQMGPTEFVAILLISNAVQNSMNGGDNSLTGGLLLASVLIFLSWSITWLTYRFRGMQHLFEGTPALLVRKGKIVEPALRRERLRRSELVAALRKQGIHNINEIDSAILEADGTMSVVKISDLSAPLATPGAN